MTKLWVVSIVLLANVWANNAVIENVRVSKSNNKYTFSVRILHKDSGWDHYVNRYEVLDENSKILATRVLVHPHEFEQPFTRSLSQVRLDESLKRVFVRAHDSVDGYSELYEVLLP